MGSSVQGQLAQLGSLPRRQLLDMWQQLYERPAPSGLRRELLIPFLAYRIQENALGGLKPRLRSELSRIQTSRSQATRRRRVAKDLARGTRIIREWRNNRYEVLATEA